MNRIDQAIKKYTPFYYTGSWLDAAEGSLHTNHPPLHKIAAVSLQTFAAIGSFFVEAACFIPVKIAYTYFYPSNPPENPSFRSPQHPFTPSQYPSNFRPLELPSAPTFHAPDLTAPPVISMPINTAPSAAIQHVREGVMVPDLEFGDGLATTTPLPWGFVSLDLTSLSEGTILYVNPDEKCSDGSMTATFAADAQLIAFQNKYNIAFNLRLSEEHQVTLSADAKQKAGIPHHATAFQFIYPAALNIKFNRDQDDTPQARANIADFIKKELRPNMQYLLLVGGFIYYKGNWHISRGNRYRLLAGINVLNPNIDSSNQTTTQLHFGQAKIVSENIQQELKTWAEMTDRFYGREPKQLTDYPAMSPITVGPLAKKNLTHFKWLQPNHPMIRKMQQELPSFGQAGVFVYYSRENPTLSCMLPVATPDEWKTLLRNTNYLKIEQPDGIPALRIAEEPKCCICQDDSPETLEQFVQFQPCGHMGTCQPCYDNLNIDRENTNAQTRHGFYWNEHAGYGIASNPDQHCKCPLCRSFITSVIPRAQLAGNSSYADIATFPSFDLPFASMNLSYLQANFAFLLNKDIFQSPKKPTPSILKRGLYLPDNYTQCSFLYPIYGKSSDLTYPYLQKIADAVQEDSNNTKILQGLVANGGFIFYNNYGEVQSVHAILPQGSPITPTGTLHLKTTKMPGNQDPIGPELTQFKDIKKDRYNICRITLQALLPFAKYFMWDGGRFVYSQGQKAAWQATIT